MYRAPRERARALDRPEDASKVGARSRRVVASPVAIVMWVELGAKVQRAPPQGEDRACFGVAYASDKPCHRKARDALARSMNQHRLHASPLALSRVHRPLSRAGYKTVASIARDAPVARALPSRWRGRSRPRSRFTTEAKPGEEDGKEQDDDQQ